MAYCQALDMRRTRFNRFADLYVHTRTRNSAATERMNPDRVTYFLFSSSEQRRENPLISSIPRSPLGSSLEENRLGSTAAVLLVNGANTNQGLYTEKCLI